MDEDLAVEFEVQVRTAFEHAWSDVTHALVYKGQHVDWRRKRLAAQLKALVEQVDSLIDSFESSASSIPESRDWRTDAQAEVLAIFDRLTNDALLDESATPDSWQRFAESAYHLARGRSRDDREAATVLEALCRDFDRAVRAGDFRVASSGSLIQALAGFAMAAWGAASLKGVPVVWDEDLQSFYGDVVPPRRVDLGS
jgi:hypothetical protein